MQHWTPNEQKLAEQNPDKSVVNKRKRRKKNKAAKAARKRNR
jgi:hypothetical protein